MVLLLPLLAIFIIVKIVKWLVAPMPPGMYIENPDDPVPLWRYRFKKN